MNGYALVEWGKPLQEYEAPNPKPTGKEVLVAVDNCGLCHSDLHIQDGDIGPERMRMDLPLFPGTKSMAGFGSSDLTRV